MDRPKRSILGVFRDPNDFPTFWSYKMYTDCAAMVSTPTRLHTMTNLMFSQSDQIGPIQSFFHFFCKASIVLSKGKNQKREKT